MSELLKGYGNHLFKGAIAAPYLKAQGLPENCLDSPEWTTDGSADKVAAAVLAWAQDNGAQVFCHWFQPLGAAGLRHGGTAMVQNTMMTFGKDGRPLWDFDGKTLLRGETDGSSYPNAGLRATHRAGAYLSIDTTSPIFLRGDSIFIPATFISYTGHSLDEKLPLLRSLDALSREGTRLLDLLGYKVKSLQSNIGLEQELFLIPREMYLKRIDLQLAGRTVLGKEAPRGQELCDHYMGPLSFATPALEAMKEMQQVCFKMGIPLKTRHREVAPNQFEFAPLFGLVTTQIDQNLVAMQVCEEIAAKHGLACLFQEKPFEGVNGSGKHNNWSIGTDDGTNLLNVQQLAERSGSDKIFPVILAAIIKGVDTYGDLMRMAISSPGNDFRLGACEAPPSIISAYLGEQMTSYLESYMNGDDKPYVPSKTVIQTGSKSVPPLPLPAEDRNRTSPFPFGGHRFEFRAVGSSQNVSMVNTVLNTMCANSFKEFADAIESGRAVQEVAGEALRKHWKSIFNGNGYDPAEQQRLTKEGLWRIDSGVEAICHLTHDKNVKLFEDMLVMTKEEVEARKEIMLGQYVGTVEIEAKSMIELLNKHVIPSARESGVGNTDDLHKAVFQLTADIKDIHNAKDVIEQAKLARVLRLERMIAIRREVDEIEGRVPAKHWSLPTYQEMLFLDSYA